MDDAPVGRKKKEERNQKLDEIGTNEAAEQSDGLMQ